MSHLLCQGGGEATVDVDLSELIQLLLARGGTLRLLQPLLWGGASIEVWFRGLGLRVDGFRVFVSRVGFGLKGFGFGIKGYGLKGSRSQIKLQLTSS